MLGGGAFEYGDGVYIVALCLVALRHEEQALVGLLDGKCLTQLGKSLIVLAVVVIALRKLKGVVIRLVLRRASYYKSTDDKQRNDRRRNAGNGDGALFAALLLGTAGNDALCGGRRLGRFSFLLVIIVVPVLLRLAFKALLVTKQSVKIKLAVRRKNVVPLYAGLV